MIFRKILYPTIIFLGLLLIAPFLFAQEIIMHKGFPIYPPIEEKIIEAQKKGLKGISLDIISPELKDKIAKDPEHFLYESVRIEIDKAIRYLEEKADDLGWRKMQDGRYADGGSRYLTFARKQSANIAIVSFVIWQPMVIVGREIPKEWGTISYNFQEHPIPFLHNRFPILPYVRTLSECKISNDFYGNKVLTITRDELSIETGLFNSLYGEQSIFPELYGWHKDKNITFKKDYRKGLQEFFMKERSVVKVIHDSYNKSASFVFFSPDEAKEIILTRREKSPGKKEQLLQKLQEFPAKEIANYQAEFNKLIKMWNEGRITKEEFEMREKQLREQSQKNIEMHH